MDRKASGTPAYLSAPLPPKQGPDFCAHAASGNDARQPLPHVLLETLLRDHTTGQNILWATDDYSRLGEGYGPADRMTVDNITAGGENVIVPRAQKSDRLQRQRSQEMAEVFTPAWICNKQNNLIDSAWFGREGVFNTEVDNPDGTHSWIVNAEPVVFPEGKTWRDYVNDNRLEITCGEAPYLASRRDAVSGELIPVERRIGLLDRKLRVVSENTETSGDWLKAAQAAYMSIYGYEWQGDNLVLAREALLQTFLDYYRAKFGKDPQLKSQQYIAYIISWNIWQMDGLKGVIPNSCGERRTVVADLFGETETVTQCQGCKNGDIRAHNGTYAIIKDWGAPKAKQKIRFIDLIK